MVKVSIGEKPKGAARRTTSVSDLCERCIIGAACQFKWYKMWAYRLRSRNGGGSDRPRQFIILVIWVSFVLAEHCGGTFTRAQASSIIGIIHPCWGL